MSNEARICHACGGAGLCSLCDGSGVDDLGIGPAGGFGSLLASLLSLRDLSQSALADKMGCLPDSISRVVRGRRYPTADTVMRMAEALELDPHESEMLMLAAGYCTGRTSVRAIAYMMPAPS